MPVEWGSGPGRMRGGPTLRAVVPNPAWGALAGAVAGAAGPVVGAHTLLLAAFAIPAGGACYGHSEVGGGQRLREGSSGSECYRKAVSVTQRDRAPGGPNS